MKSLFTLIVTITSFMALGQQPKWEELKLDSADFAFQYGTESQYSYQKKLQDKSKSKMACIFIGAQFVWWYEIVTYLNSKNYKVEIDANDKQFQIIALSPNRKNTPDSVLIATAFLNKHSQITKAIITGPNEDIYTLFFDFWDTESLTLREMATKRQVIKTLESDKIAMKFIGKNLMIAITRNENFPNIKFELKD